MRIFCAVRHSNDPRFFYGGLWSTNFYPALRELGHEIIESQTDLLPTSCFMGIADGFTREEREVQARTTEAILNEVQAALRHGPVDLFLSYFYNSHFDPDGFNVLRKLDIPSVNFYCNSMYQFAQVAAIAASADYSWHAERDARTRYTAIGANPIWVQMGADPNIYRPVNHARRQPKACFVGQRYADRDRLAASLIRANVPLDLYGSGWGKEETVQALDPQAPTYLGRSYCEPGSINSHLRAAAAVMRTERGLRGLMRLQRQYRYRSETRRLSPVLAASAKGRAHNLPEVFAAYETILNFSNVWADGRPGSRLIPHVRLRDFEAPMCRSCYLTGHTDEIGEFYELGTEISTYQDITELVDKTRFYIAHPDAAERLREAGYKRALRDHTWRRRFEELFRKIKPSTN